MITRRKDTRPRTLAEIQTFIADIASYEPCWVHYYTGQKFNQPESADTFYHLSVHPRGFNTHDVQPIAEKHIDKLVKQGELIPWRTWDDGTHFGPYLVATVDYVSAAIAALKAFIAEGQARLDATRASRRQWLAGERREWIPGIESYDWLGAMLRDETAIQFAERELVYFLYLKSLGVKHFDADYSDIHTGISYTNLHK